MRDLVNGNDTIHMKHTGLSVGGGVGEAVTGGLVSILIENERERET